MRVVNKAENSALGLPYSPALPSPFLSGLVHFLLFQPLKNLTFRVEQKLGHLLFRSSRSWLTHRFHPSQGCPRPSFSFDTRLASSKLSPNRKPPPRFTIGCKTNSSSKERLVSYSGAKGIRLCDAEIKDDDNMSTKSMSMFWFTKVDFSTDISRKLTPHGLVLSGFRKR